MGTRNQLNPDEWVALKEALRAPLPRTDAWKRVSFITQNLSVASYYLMNLAHSIWGTTSFNLSKSPLSPEHFFKLLHIRGLLLLICLLVWDFAYLRSPRAFSFLSVFMLTIDGLSLGLDIETYLLFLMPDGYIRVGILILLRGTAIFCVLRDVLSRMNEPADLL